MRQRVIVTCLTAWFCAACHTGNEGRPFLPPLGPTANVPLPAPSPVPAPAPARPPVSFPLITVGEVVRFQFTNDDWACAGATGRCRSYNITAPSDGLMSVAVTSTSADTSFLGSLEMYVVPGADDWEVGPGPQIGARVAVRAGLVYEIRMFSSTVPSTELELRTALSPR
jgi:hypothetical protein